MKRVFPHLLVLAGLWAGGHLGGAPAGAAGAQPAGAREPTDALRCWRRLISGVQSASRRR